MVVGRNGYHDFKLLEFPYDAWVAGSVQSRITLFYGSPYSQCRQFSWDLLRRLASFSIKP